jgi:D-alanyl-D-alanine carboxypeptidase/D-alanyl-D-alanine-endopeptidase (penicillin-binding protein 4)
MRKIFPCLAGMAFLLVFTGCSTQKKIAREAGRDILDNPDFKSAHIGITLYDPATGQYIYDHQGDKFFVPASNTKLLTCYAAMKNLGDSLVGIRYVDKGNGTVEVEPNGDASFLHPDFPNQPVLDFLKKKTRVLITDENWRENALGFGWAWDDYNSDYMAERSAMPVYGNVIRFTQAGTIRTLPAYFQNNLSETVRNATGNFGIRRDMASNTFTTRNAGTKFNTVDIPMYTRENSLLIKLLSDTLKNRVEAMHAKIERPDVVKIYSQPTDSLLKIMMHRSDNFFAEQTLLMVSNERLGFMSDARIIDTLLKTDFAGLPQKPKWVDGSGLSRYNLVSPQDFVWVLTQMKNEFKWERIQAILPTGGEGTISSYYKNYAGRIYAKTGSLSNHLALSGYITTKKGRQLIFSVLVNAELAPATNIRKGVERFLIAVMEGN